MPKEIKLIYLTSGFIGLTVYSIGELRLNVFEASRIESHAPFPAAGASPLESSFSARNRIVYAGQVLRGKGVDVLLRALKRLRVEFECIILGDGSHRAHCQRLARSLGLEDRVVVKGYVPPDELPAYYAEASLAVMSS